MKILFMGTPEFGATILERLQTKHEIVLVVTQKDTYRKNKLVFNPVKQVALKYGLDVFQPEKIRNEEDYIYKYNFDLIVTAAFGQFVGEKLLNYPKYKAINVHGSLLPKYRGGAPIQRSIMNGDQQTGITIMYMSKKMDAGNIILQKSVDILEYDTADMIFLKLASLGSDMIMDVIDNIDNIESTPQDEKLVTYAYNLTKEDELINFTKEARLVNAQIRGLCSNPGAYFVLNKMIYKVYGSTISTKKSIKEPGTIISVDKSSFSVSCGNGTVITFFEIKPEGKKIMNVCDYLNGKGKNILMEGVKINEA